MPLYRTGTHKETIFTSQHTGRYRYHASTYYITPSIRTRVSEMGNQAICILHGKSIAAAQMYCPLQLTAAYSTHHTHTHTVHTNT